MNPSDYFDYPKCNITHEANIAVPCLVMDDV